MTESPEGFHRRQPLLPAKDGRNRDRIGEVAGGTAAECAAVCFCCPCAVVNLLVLAVYRVPVGLCRKAWRRRKRKRWMVARAKKNSAASKRYASDGEDGEIGGAEAVDLEEEEEEVGSVLRGWVLEESFS
ncbi:hypothetical protein RJ639_003252 [Escallonia herrerae]|uniref:Uncharacterized protein n=1 Tax=Escallonia herrerae TaxID=1293975 RepID=A0AA89AWX4_9ASTE|nr:hypothetical protein RJ639_003252 [Escallonia herrerae]